MACGHSGQTEYDLEPDKRALITLSEHTTQVYRVTDMPREKAR